MTKVVVCSFWVHRPQDFPEAADYLSMLRILDRCCQRWGYEHVVLTDHSTEPQVSSAGMRSFATNLPRNLLQAATEAHARWLESGRSCGVDTVFTGADCLFIADFRPHLKTADLSITLFDHKRLWILTGFMHVPATSRTKMTPLFRRVANDTRPLKARTCDDMMAWERVLAPRPERYGVYERAGIVVDFHDEMVWNRQPTVIDDDYDDALVLHFRGGAQKPMLFEWTRRHMPELMS